MKDRRTFCVALLTLVFFPQLTTAQIENQAVLHEALLDLAAFVKPGGFSYNDYKPKAASIAAELDRYTRRKGKDSNLIAAAEAYIDAKKQWDIQFDVTRKKQEYRSLGVFLPDENAKLDEIEMSALKARLKDWETADAELEKYSSERSTKKAKPKPPVSAKPTSNVK